MRPSPHKSTVGARQKQHHLTLLSSIPVSGGSGDEGSGGFSGLTSNSLMSLRRIEDVFIPEVSY
jgi:hypothetical protein